MPYSSMRGMLTATLLGLLLACQQTEASPPKPNIILIYADDMGYGDAGCYGESNLVPTPNIDRLAREGVRFTQGYVTASVCGPSRYGLLTGMYQQRMGVYWNQDAWYDAEETVESNRIPAEQVSIDRAIKRAGYATGMVGKYNLPGYPKTTFDDYRSVMHFGGDYFPEEDGTYTGVDAAAPHCQCKRVIWGPQREGDEYLTDRLGRQAVDFIERHQDEPFFFYLGFNAPHSPMQAKASLKPSVSHLPSEATKLYGAMLISMDDNIGRVLDALDRLGLAENTLVAFASDNGATFAYNVEWPEDWPRELLGSNGPLREHKGTDYEGGIRIPYILRWPAALEAGQVYEKAVSTLDLYPTFCTAAGATVPEGTRLDGVDLMPYLQGAETGEPHDYLYWHQDWGGAVLHGDWKLHVAKDRVQLFNLATDIGESNDLSQNETQIVAELRDAYERFVDPLPGPLNPKARD